VTEYDNRKERRLILGAGMGLGLSACGLSARAAQDNPAAGRPQAGDLLVRVGDASSTPLAAQDIAADSRQTFAWAMDPADGTLRNATRLNRVLILRFDPGKLTPETKERAVDGVVAYSAICPHAGCEITEWIQAEETIYCPCHASKFEPKDGGKVLDGPAPKPLPALPLKLSESKLVVARAFTSRITFEQG
jgi:Rieske Fe-S protein